MATTPQRRWLRYNADGEAASRWTQPLYYGLAYVAASLLVQTIDAFYWMSRGEDWFGSTAGKQVPVLAIILAVLAFIGLSRRPEH